MNKFMVGFTIGALLYVIFSSYDKDTTDPKDSRSGLGLYIDNATGCHYLSAGLLGGITPRMNEFNKHICE